MSPNIPPNPEIDKNNPQQIMKLVQENQMRIHQNQMMIQMYMENNNTTNQIMGEINGKQTALTNDQVVYILRDQQSTIDKLTKELSEKM